MSSVLDCIRRLAAAGKISDRHARDAEALYGRVMQDDLLQKMDRADAEAHAALRVAETIRERAREQKRALAKSVNNYTYAGRRLREHPDGPIAGFMGMLDRDIKERAGDRLNASGLDLEYYRPQLAAKIHAFDEAYRSTAAGLRQDTNGVRDFIREVFGQTTGDGTAAAAAKGWLNAVDWATEKAKGFGRPFQKNDEWRVPQFWSTDRVNRFGPGEFKADLQREIDRGGLKVFDDMGAPITDPAKRSAALDKAIHDIRLDMSGNAGPGSVFKDEQRTFRFQKGVGGDSYLRLMDKYGPGQGGYFGMLQSHTERMARELAMMHLFGPSFRTMTARVLEDAVKLQRERDLSGPSKTWPAWLGDKMVGWLGSEGAAKKLQQYMSGELTGAESESVAGFFQGLRAFLTSTNMGSAIVTAIPADSVNWLMASRFRGLDMGRLVGGVTDTFLRDSADKEAFALRLGITAHAASRAALMTKTYGDMVFGGGPLKVMKGLADTVIRAQGLHAWDQAISRSFSMEVLASIGERGGVAWDALDTPFKRFMTDYGFTADEWAKLSAAERTGAGGAQFLSMNGLDAPLHAKLASMIADEKQFAYLAGGSNRIRAIATGGAKAGTLSGELQRSFFLFKQFPLTMLATHGLRAAQEMARNGAWGYAASLGLFMTMAGALAIQARQVLQGKDPRAMENGDFWLQSALQGGAVGIYGDFLKDGFSRSQTSLLETAVGPGSEILESAQRLMSSAYRQQVDGASTNYGAELAQDLQKFTPGSTLWYTRLLASRFLYDQIRMQLDPDYGAAFQRERDRMMKNYGADYYWPRGEIAPERAPQLGRSE
jgi:hypothetical protein